MCVNIFGIILKMNILGAKNLKFSCGFRLKEKCIPEIHVYTNSMEQSLSRETVSQLVKELTEFYGTRRFITLFTSVCQLSLSKDR
jgi:hypothetical protein